MNTESYRFMLGDFECVSLSDGGHDYPLKNFFANVPIEQVEEALRQRSESVDYVTTPYTYLYVDTGEHRVLVDMGAGRLLSTTGRLLESMDGAGIDPADIDIVMITHAHADHVGGTLDDQGKPVFGNARHYIWKGEWEFWTSEAAFAKAPEKFVTFARNSLEPIRERLGFIDHEGEVVPGIGVIPAPGHTPGHMVVSVSSGQKRLLYVGDTVLYPLHLEHPDWLPIYDILPEEAAASKRRIFDLAAEEKALVMGQHFPPFPSLGYVVKKGKGWHWQPIETSD